MRLEAAARPHRWVDRSLPLAQASDDFLLSRLVAGQAAVKSVTVPRPRRHPAPATSPAAGDAGHWRLWRRRRRKSRLRYRPFIFIPPRPATAMAARASGGRPKPRPPAACASALAIDRRRMDMKPYRKIASLPGRGRAGRCRSNDQFSVSSLRCVTPGWAADQDP